MKKIIFALVMLVMSSVMAFSQTTYNVADVNQDGHVSVADVAAVVEAVNQQSSTKQVINADEVKDLISRLEHRIAALEALHGIYAKKKILFEGKFSVSPEKTVQFTTGCLYYNYLEQIYYIGQQVEKKVCRKIDDKSSAYTNVLNISGTPEKLNPSSDNKTKQSFTEDNKFKLEGEELYLLTSKEWMYLLFERENHDKLFGYSMVDGFQVAIIAPDNYNKPLKPSYTPEELEEEELVALQLYLLKDSIQIFYYSTGDKKEGNNCIAIGYDNFSKTFGLEDTYLISPNRIRLVK